MDDQYSSVLKWWMSVIGYYWAGRQKTAGESCVSWGILMEVLESTGNVE